MSGRERERARHSVERHRAVVHIREGGWAWNEGEEEKSEERRKNRPMKKGQAEAALVAAAASSQYIIERIGSLEVSILKKYSL